MTLEMYIEEKAEYRARARAQDIAQDIVKDIVKNIAFEQEKNTIRRMLEIKIPIEQISYATGLSESEIKSIKNQI